MSNYWLYDKKFCCCVSTHITSIIWLYEFFSSASSVCLMCVVCKSAIMAFSLFVSFTKCFLWKFLWPFETDKSINKWRKVLNEVNIMHCFDGFSEMLIIKSVCDFAKFRFCFELNSFEWDAHFSLFDIIYNAWCIWMCKWLTIYKILLRLRLPDLEFKFWKFHDNFPSFNLIIFTACDVLLILCFNLNEQ